MSHESDLSWSLYYKQLSGYNLCDGCYILFYFFEEKYDISNDNTLNSLLETNGTQFIGKGTAALHVWFFLAIIHHNYFMSLAMKTFSYCIGFKIRHTEEIIPIITNVYVKIKI